MAGNPKKRAKKKHERAEERIANLPMVIPPPEEPKDRWGRPSSFRPEYVEHARILCEEGFTDQEIADHFDVSKRTIYNWQKDHPEFLAVFKLGKALADDRAERTLFEQAMGYTTTVTEIIKLRDNQGNEYVKEVERQVRIPPNAELLKFFLKNRRSETWKDKTEQHHTGKIEHELTREQMEERVAAKLQELRQRQLPRD